MTKSMVSGSAAKSTKYGLGRSGQETLDLIKDRTGKSMVSGRVAKSKKHELRKSWQANARFDKRLKNRTNGLWRGCQIGETGCCEVSVRKLRI